MILRINKSAFSPGPHPLVIMIVPHCFSNLANYSEVFPVPVPKAAESRPYNSLPDKHRDDIQEPGLTESFGIPCPLSGAFPEGNRDDVGGYDVIFRNRSYPRAPGRCDEYKCPPNPSEFPPGYSEGSTIGFGMRFIDLGRELKTGPIPGSGWSQMLEVFEAHLTPLTE
jgi:hypothetical protein